MTYQEDVGFATEADWVPASPSEKQWLDACIRAKKYVPEPKLIEIYEIY